MESKHCAIASQARQVRLFNTVHLFIFRVLQQLDLDELWREGFCWKTASSAAQVSFCWSGLNVQQKMIMLRVIRLGYCAFLTSHSRQFVVALQTVTINLSLA